MDRKDFPRIPDSEFAARMINLKKEMEKQSIDLLVVFGNMLDPAHVRYLSDFSPLNESSAAVVPREGDPILCTGQACHAWAKHKSRINNIRILPEIGEVGGVEYEIKGLTTFESLFKEIRSEYKIKRVGKVGTLVFPLVIYQQITKVFPEAEVVEAEKILYNLRTIKSKNEISCMRKAAEILDKAFQKAVTVIRPGWTELDIQAEIEAGVLRGGAEDHALSWTPMIPSGAQNTQLCMNRNSLRKVKKGEIIDLQAGSLYEGYNAALCTPFVLGKVPEKMRKAVKVSYQVMESVAEKLRPGTTSRELNEAGRSILKKEGYSEYSPYGLVHSIGLLECELPWFPVDGNLQVVAGMAVCADVFFFGMEWGSFRLEDVFVVRKDGPEQLTKFNKAFIPQFYK